MFYAYIAEAGKRFFTVTRKTDLVLIGLFGRADLSIADKYLLTLSYRRDGTSRFSQENRWGNPAPLAMDSVQLELSGPGTIAGVGNGNPQSFKPFQRSTLELFYGKAVIIIKAGSEPGHIRLTASTKKLGQAEVVVEVIDGD